MATIIKICKPIAIVCTVINLITSIAIHNWYGITINTIFLIALV